MTQHRHSIRLRVLALIALAGLGAPLAAQTTLRYTDHEPLGNMRTTLINGFLAEVERESRGRLKADAHWGADISTGYDALATVAQGKAANIGVIVPEYSDKALPLHQVFKSFLTGPSGANQVALLRRIYREVPEFEAELRRNGVEPVFIATGYPVGFFSAKPMENLAQMKGQRWRTASFWHRDFLTHYGAVPVTMAWGPDVAMALGDGRLDGLMVNIDSALDLDVPRTAPNSLVSRRLWLGHVYVVAMNRDAWQQLPARDQAAIRRAAERSYRSLGAIMDRSYSRMAARLARLGTGSRELRREEVDAFAAEAQVSATQDAWARAQNAAGRTAAPSVLNQVRGLWRQAMRRER